MEAPILPKDAVAPAADACPPGPAGRLVLVVEDTDVLRQGLVRLVEMHGHRTLAAATIAEATAHLAAGPSHVLLDMNLPDGVGTTVLRQVRDERRPIKVAVLSGSGDDRLMAEAQSLGPDAMFRKPPDWDALMRWVDA